MQNNNSTRHDLYSDILTGASVFLVSFAVLFFEITYPRILVFMRYYNTITIIPIAMLGIGSGAVFSYFMGRSRTAHFVFLLIFPVSILIAFYILVFYDERIFIILSAAFVFFVSSVIITYFFIIGRSNRIYFYNLAGAGLGVAVSFFVFPLIGGESSILLSAVLASFSAVLACLNTRSFQRFRRTLAAFQLVIFLAITAAFVYNLYTDRIDIIKMMPLSAKGGNRFLTAHGILKETENRHLYKKWSLISRIDAISSKKSLWDSPYKGERVYLYQNDLYFSYLPISDTAYIRNPAYVLYPEPKALILGTGGGVDIAIARGNNCKRPVGVEIDPAIVDIMQNELGQSTANVYNAADISVIDGRAFVRMSHNAYDVILMNFTDMNIAFPNSQVFMEYYLYTVEAIQDYLNALTDNGLIYINKWVSVGKGMKPELLRITATALESLKQRGIAEPEKHLFIAAENPRKTVVFPGAVRGFILIKKSPFTAAESAKITACIQNSHTVMHPVKEVIPDNNFAYLIKSKSRDQIIEKLRNDISPTTDDRPYFNEFDKKHILARNTAHDFIKLLVFLILIPLIIILLLDKNLRKIKTPLYLFFFTLTGLSFMLFETYLIQKFNLVLGSPIYSFTFTVGAILLSAGIGGFFSTRIEKKHTVILVALIPPALGLYYILIHNFAHNLLNLPLALRIILSAVVLFPVFFLLGIPFPSVMARAREVFSERSAGIMYAVDASFSTLAVVSSILLSMMYGFTLLLGISVALYAALVPVYFFVMRYS